MVVNFCGRFVLNTVSKICKLNIAFLHMYKCLLNASYVISNVIISIVFSFILCVCVCQSLNLSVLFSNGSMC